MENNEPFNQPNKFFRRFLKNPALSVILVSLLMGGLAGGVAGFVSASFFSGSFANWLNNPLGLSVGPADNNQNVNQQPAGGGQNSANEYNEESATTQAVAKVSPAVVSIVITKELQQYNNISDFPFQFFFNNTPFDQFFNSQQPSQQQAPSQPQKQKVGGGTGFVITADGLIATNKHVVADTKAEYSVVFSDGKTYDATVVGRDPFNDVAFIKIDAHNLPVVSLGDSGNLKTGQTVMAIGFSLGEYSNSVTKGIISGINRDIVAGGQGASEKLEGVIQTDAAINPGNSGGPLIDLQGQVIGINTAINQQGQLVGFAIPINNLKQVIQSVKEKGKIVRPYLGVRYVVITEELAKENKLPYQTGALVIRGENNELAVAPGSPADNAGLVENDIILEINGVKLDMDHSLSKEIAGLKPGDVINLKVYHQGAEKNIQVTLGEYPS